VTGQNNLSTSQNKVLSLITDSKSLLTQKQILEATGLSLRTVKYALRFLVKNNLAREHLDFRDIRMKKYGGMKNE